MDMKKKLEETYMPDKDTRRPRLVVGLSGGLNSFVSAYLLKIQKYDLIGVTIVTGQEDLPGKPENSLFCHLSASKLEAIKEFCHQLGISHVLVKAQEEFKEGVVDRWLANRLTGTKASPCWNCHEIRLKLLHQKMIEFEAQGIATGHLAKIFRHESHHSVFVHSSNDEENDQSDLLSRLPHDVLDKLVLPLSDLQQKEITKLAENFGVSSRTSEIKMHQCLNLGSEAKSFFEARVPKKYIQSAEMLDAEKNSLGDHSGVVTFSYGQSLEQLTRQKNQVLFMSGYSFQERKISFAPEEFFHRSSIFLTNCQVSEETPWTEPLRGVLRAASGHGDCWVYPKNLNSALVILDQPMRMLEGEVVTVFKKKGKNSKVYLTGLIRFFEGAAEEEGSERVKVDYSRDF